VDDRAHTEAVRFAVFLVVLICLQTAAEVLPDSVSGVPWTQPQAMKYGGFVLIVVLTAWIAWWLRVRRATRREH
jgi:hypothetical protein